MAETALYPPVKAHLEAQGYAVKGEIEGCDVVAVRGDDPPVIVELKGAFSLALVYQGVDRQRISDAVYLAVPHREGKAAAARLGDAAGLCRRLGLGLITVREAPGAGVIVHTDPGPFRPHKMAARRTRLLREFARRTGDTMAGGTPSRRPAMTAYRQDALRCASLLAVAGPTKAAEVARAASVTRAPGILQRDVYGWFERVSRGIYALTPAGHAALDAFADQIAALDPGPAG